MSGLSNLKLIVAKKPKQLSPVAARRGKMVQRIQEQLDLAKAKQSGTVYAPMKQRKVKDEETGEAKTVQVPKRLKEWWFVADNGKTCVSLRYGAKVISLGAKGVTAVELANAKDLVPTLETLKQAVETGELDAQLESVSGAVKAGFKK